MLQQLSRLSVSLAALFMLCACKASSDEKREQSSVPQKEQSLEIDVQSSPKEEVSTLLTLDSSAYRSSIAVDGRVITLVTEEAIYRLSPGEGSLKREVEVASEPAFTERAVIFFREGKLYSIEKVGGKERVLGALAAAPRQLLASKDNYAWLSRSVGGKYSVRTLKKGKDTLLFETSRELSSAAMLDDWVFFVEKVQPNGFRIGGVSLSGREPAFTVVKEGRTPAMLGVGEDLYFYDLAKRSVFRISPDLSQEEIVAEKVVCSPLAIADQIYCAQVEGLFSLPLKGGPPTTLTHKPYGLVARIAASSQLLAWVNETGREQLSLRVQFVKPARR